MFKLYHQALHSIFHAVVNSDLLICLVEQDFIFCMTNKTLCLTPNLCALPSLLANERGFLKILSSSGAKIIRTFGHTVFCLKCQILNIHFMFIELLQRPVCGFVPTPRITTVPIFSIIALFLMLFFPMQ